MDRGVWSQYADLHPWLVADPSDPTVAYCNVCCRRFNYGHSKIKRKNHENSEKHKAAVEAAAAANAEENESAEAGEDGEDSQDEQEQSETEALSEVASNEEDRVEDNSEEDDKASLPKSSKA